MNSRRLASAAATALALSATSISALGATGGDVPESIAPAQHLSLPVLIAPAVEGAVVRVAQAGDTADLFTWAAEKTEGTISLTGDAPNSAIKSFLAVRAGAGTSDSTTVSGGGPDYFTDYSLAGLAALEGLTSGRVSYTGSKWTLGGFAPSQEALDATMETLGTAVDMTDWVVFVEVAQPEAMDTAEAAATAAPEAAPDLLNWSVSREKFGDLEFNGEVPNASLQSFLRVRAGEGFIDNSEVGGTAPEGFIDDALAAVAAVQSLESGRAAFTGSKWTLGGFAERREELDALLEDLSVAVDASDWVIFIEVSPPFDPSSMAGVVTMPTEPIGAAEPEFQFNALKADGGDIALSGNVPSAAFASYAGVIAGGDAMTPVTAGGEYSGGGLTINTTAPDGFINEATVALRALNTLESGLLTFENGQWSLIGDALSDEAAADVSAAITGLPEGDQWVLDLAVVPVFQLCADVVKEFSDTHTILFAPGSANLTPDSATALVDLTDELKKCPAADLHIEGHTDADGPEDSNMALSVARAEAVIAELIELGLDERRLYAIGYGETLPVASNDTTAGKAQNRRIVFELVR